MKTSAQEIDKAQKALKDSGIVNSDGKYKSVFSGYISSFGASLVQAGLLPTVIFYENKDSEAKERYKVIEALKKMLGINSKQLSVYLLSNHKSDDNAFNRQVADAMVALKLALRIYEEEKGDKKNG